MQTIKNTSRGVVAAVLFTAGTAGASPGYPEIVQSALDVPCVVECTICHIDNNGGLDTLKVLPGNLPGFGMNLRDSADLGIRNPESLREALARAEMDPAAFDVDGDGIGDIEELRNGTDPNVAGETPLCGPEYGCFARVAPERASRFDGIAAAVAAVAVAFLARVGRRRRG